MTVLTAAHVIGGLFPWLTDETSVVGYGDLQPDEAHDTATAPLPALMAPLGRLERSVPPAMAASCTTDAAIARAVSRRELVNSIDDQPIAGALDIRDLHNTDIPVRMLAARSKRREGILNTARVADRIRIAFSDNYVFYEHGCLIRGNDGEFAKPGDSGSVVVDDANRVIAMVVGLFEHDDDAPRSTFAVPIAAVLEELDVKLFDAPLITTDLVALA